MRNFLAEHPEMANEIETAIRAEYFKDLEPTEETTEVTEGVEA